MTASGTGTVQAEASAPTSHAAVTLFGATGYTGRLVAVALDRAGLEYRIAGRSPERLARLSAELTAHPAWLVADAQLPSTIQALFSGTRVLINCAGPFTDLGERVVARAAMSGVHYLDTTNELGFVMRARGYSEVAAKTGAVITPACAFEIALADCAAHRAAERLGYSDQIEASGPLDEINVLYTLMGQASRGTLRSAVRTLATSWLAYRNGAWIGQMPGGATRNFPLQDGQTWGISFPSCESIAIPQHVRTQRVDTWFTTTNTKRRLGRVLLPIFARVSRSILRGLILRLAERGGLKPEQRGSEQPTPFAIHALARRGTQTATVTLRGMDPYGLTAEIIVHAARRLVEGSVERRGFLAPAQLFDPREFLSHAGAEWGVTVEESGPVPIGRTVM
jgi:short subunit dehydrogenase-like uncharacterized protein